MDVNIWSFKGAKWHIHGKDKYLVLERYPLMYIDEPLPSPFLPVVDAYGDEVLIDFFASQLLPFHYLRMWGKDAREVFLERLKSALKYDIAHVKGYTLNNIIFSEGQVYILPPKRSGFTLGEVLSQLEHYLQTCGSDAYGVPPQVAPTDVDIVIRRGVYHLEKPFHMGHIYGLMRRLIIWGYYPILSVAPSEFMEGARFMRTLAFYMPWYGKVSVYDMVPSISLVMQHDTRISVGIGSIVERVIDSLGAKKVAFITLGMPKIRDMYYLTRGRDIVIYTDEDADVSISLGGNWKGKGDCIRSTVACRAYTMKAMGKEPAWEDSSLLTDVKCNACDVKKEDIKHLDSTSLLLLWEETKSKDALALAVWKDRYEHRLVSQRMYKALVESGLIDRRGFYGYLAYGIIKNGMADMYPYIVAYGKWQGLPAVFQLLASTYMGNLPEFEEISSLLKSIKDAPMGRVLWIVFLIAGYMLRTSWEEDYETLHEPLLDFMYISPFDGMDKWLFLTAKNAYAITYMHSGNLNEAYSIISSIVPHATRHGYFDILFKVYNNLSILSSEVSPRLASKYLLLATMYALVSGGTSLGGVFSSLLTEEVQRAPMRVLRRIYDVGWSVSLDENQEFVLLATWVWVLIRRGYIKDATRYMKMLEKKYAFPTEDITKDIEYYYLSLSLHLLKGDVGTAKDMAYKLFDMLDMMPLAHYRPDIYKKLAQLFYHVGDRDKLAIVQRKIAERYGTDSISYMFVSSLLSAIQGQLYSAIDLMKDVYRKNLHVWKLLDAAESAFFIGDLYCQMDKGKIASVYYRKAEVLLTRLEAMRLLRFMLARHDVCVSIDITSDFHRRMVVFTGEARKLMEEMYSLILDLESENFFLDRVLDMFSMITDVSSLDVVLERMLTEILHIMPAEKGYIATVGEDGDVGIWVSYSLDGRNPLRYEFAFAPEDVVKRGGVFISSPSAIGEVEYIGKQHLVVYLQNDTGTGVFGDMDEYFLIKLMEIIRVAVLMESLGSVSVRDKLTDLYARWYGMKRGNEEFEKAKRGIYPISVLYMDLDGFKEINDTYGHGIGDKVLSHVGSIIRQSVRYMDIPFRYGGDEFIVVLPATSVQGAKEVAKRIVDAIFGFFEKYPYKVSISIGVASYPQDEATSFEDLMKIADKRLYKAKSLGKNRYYTGGEET